MSRAAIDQHRLTCPNQDKYSHDPLEDIDNPIVVAAGVLKVLPRIYYADFDAGARDVGISVPVSFCNRCFSNVDVAAMVEEAVKANAEQLQVGASFRESEWKPWVEHTVRCMNADKADKHLLDTLGETHDVIVRGLFALNPTRFTTYVDAQPYRFWGEIDCCLHCLRTSWPLMNEVVIQRYIGVIEGEDLDSNPDKTLPQNMIALMANESKKIK